MRLPTHRVETRVYVGNQDLNWRGRLLERGERRRAVRRHGDREAEILERRFPGSDQTIVFDVKCGDAFYRIDTLLQISLRRMSRIAAVWYCDFGDWDANLDR